MTLSSYSDKAASEVYAVLDFETSGLNPGHGDRAIEIGISLMRDGIEVDTFSSLINPGVRVSTFITGLTGISNRMLVSAPSAREVMPEALKFVGSAHLVAHNASFDKKFWRHELQNTLGVDNENDFLCTLLLSRRIFQSFSSHRLGMIARELAIEVKDSHRALADAQVTSRALAVMIEHLHVAHPADVIHGKFLHSYQRKSRSILPDLTTLAQSAEHAQCVRAKHKAAKTPESREKVRV